jgi:hypothetical protein
LTFIRLQTLELPPDEQQAVFNEGFAKSLKPYKFAGYVSRVTDGAVCSPGPVDGTNLLYTDASSVAEARRAYPTLVGEDSFVQNAIKNTEIKTWTKRKVKKSIFKSFQK